MKGLLIIIFFLSIINLVFCQENELIIDNDTSVGTIKDEIFKFIKKTDKINCKICKYYVYVIYIYPLNNFSDCVGYTVGYILNNSSYDDVTPQYIVLDSTNLILVNFNKNIKNKIIPELTLKKITENEKQKILSKLSPKGRVITSNTSAFIYDNCNNIRKWKYYKNDIDIPFDKTIYQNFPFNDYEMKLLKEPDR